MACRPESSVDGGMARKWAKCGRRRVKVCCDVGRGGGMQSSRRGMRPAATVRGHGRHGAPRAGEVAARAGAVRGEEGLGAAVAATGDKNEELRL